MKIPLLGERGKHNGFVGGRKNQLGHNITKKRDDCSQHCTSEAFTLAVQCTPPPHETKAVCFVFCSAGAFLYCKYYTMLLKQAQVQEYIVYFYLNNKQLHDLSHKRIKGQHIFTYLLTFQKNVILDHHLYNLFSQQKINLF